MTWPWLTSCWMIRSWQPENTGSGSWWTPYWSRTSISSSGSLRLPMRAPPRDSRNHLLLPMLKILFEDKPTFSPLLWYPMQCLKMLQELSLKGKLKSIPQAMGPSLKMQLRWGPTVSGARVVLWLQCFHGDRRNWVQLNKHRVPPGGHGYARL